MTYITVPEMGNERSRSLVSILTRTGDRQAGRAPVDTPVDAAERYHQARFTWDQMCGLETIPTADATDGVLTVRFP